MTRLRLVIGFNTIPLALAVFLLGCDAKRPDAPTNRELAEPDSSVVQDSTGYRTTLRSKPLRIVSTAPSNTEILYAIGAGDRLVGVTTYCTYPPEASRCEKIGGFSPKTISTEKIVALRPDLVLTTCGMQEAFTQSLRELGLVVLSYDAATLDDVLCNIRLIGKVTDQSEPADTLAERLKHRTEMVRARLADLPKDQRPKVLLLISDSPLMTAGPTTFPGQLIEAAGGRNVFADTEQQYPKISEEEIVRRNPDLIVVLDKIGASVALERLRKRSGWSELPAVRNGRVYPFEDDLLSRAGPRLFDGLEQLATILHPTGEKP
jgi:iron complex transport system substrate-binding protein